MGRARPTPPVPRRGAACQFGLGYREAGFARARPMGLKRKWLVEEVLRLALGLGEGALGSGERGGGAALCEAGRSTRKRKSLEPFGATK